MNPRQASARWWTSFPLAPGETVMLTLGPLTLRLRRSEGEWWLCREPPGDEEATGVERIVSDAPWSVEHYDRFVCCRADGTAALKPALADRAVVVRPRQPVYVLPGEETTLYISTPVWVRIETGDPPRALAEVATLRLSDTWFGPSAREGELCYAARTHARSHLQEVPWRPHRAVTPVHVRNGATTRLPIDRLCLPVPLLSLYGRADGGLWTEGVSLTRSTDTDMAALRMASDPPPEAGDAQRLAGPRVVHDKVGLVRAFSGLFG